MRREYSFSAIKFALRRQIFLYPAVRLMKSLVLSALRCNRGLTSTPVQGIIRRFSLF
ncbi:hypothetical protein [Superficieibacter sp. 1612_C1]|uniref:hypothetical protein n=1 Tax=unclassified Superficieibacter TaxID=2645744 RepID=UPI0029052156|nr:hypothetical protein [Enterobacteriaceae bacterium]